MGSESQVRRARRIKRIMAAMGMKPTDENVSWANEVEAWERKEAGRQTFQQLIQKRAEVRNG